MIWHWLKVELWGPLWPNMFAPSIITLAWVGILHLKAKWHRERQHEDLKQHVTAAVAGPPEEGK